MTMHLLLIRNCHSKTGRITLRIAASSTLFSRFGPMLFLFVPKHENMVWWKAIHIKRGSHRRNRGLFCGVRQPYFLDGLKKLEYRRNKCIELKGKNIKKKKKKKKSIYLPNTGTYQTALVYDSYETL